MDEQIMEYLQLLNCYIYYLQEISKAEKDRFVDDYLLRGSAERYLQLAIECCIKIGNRLLSMII
ncbi:MAG: HepT-like ribonuclease domain-containing protein [Desulfomonilia bacterium]